MERRQIANAFFGLVVAAGAALMIEMLAGDDGFGILGWVGLGVLAVGLLGLLYLYLTSKGRADIVGDSYSNSGNNYGHMGPINYGPQPRRLQAAEAADLRAELLKMSRDKPVRMMAQAGDAEAIEFGEEILTYLEQNGYTVSMAYLNQGRPLKGLSLHSDGDEHRLLVGINAP